MGGKLLLVEYDDCFALLSTKQEIKGGDYMADTRNIYKAPEIDGFIGFLKVVACSKLYGDLPLIDENQIDIPNSVRHQKFWGAKIEVDDLGEPKLNNGFINLIGIKIPEKQ
jgi:hypothetical protein